MFFPRIFHILDYSYSIYCKQPILLIMYKIIVLTIVCFTIVNANLQDDIQNKASEALKQGEALKV